MSLRAFIALPLPEPLRRRVARLQTELGAVLPQVRWVKSEQLHLTLRFFAELPEECLDQVRETMLSVGNFHAPFRVDIGGLGAFPNLARPRVFWLALSPETPLLALQQRLDRGLRERGLGGEGRPFKPHLTLGRAKEGHHRSPAPLAAFQSWRGGAWEIGELVCYQSRLSAAGALHTPLFQATLGNVKTS
ncbi:RNA 2',3'-cyclic phosphodiesterase [Geoalkalibacter sp.]|uniref:RNA 2',3'-cyclic phosphodiesterase n=1 Tax=Geoalkalibacter sp. TaxID=3041440 RepID=UPI00272DCE94|nr:RNA 2',3'-cyclic phosphodiesterase [Geoalkalibacter sp.]